MCGRGGGRYKVRAARAFVVAATAATNFVHARFPRAERGAALASAPSRATATELDALRCPAFFSHDETRKDRISGSEHLALHLDADLRPVHLRDDVLHVIQSGARGTPRHALTVHPLLRRSLSHDPLDLRADDVLHRLSLSNGPHR